MKTAVIMAVAAILSMGAPVYATSAGSVAIPVSVTESSQVCQFSLSTYSGKIDSNGCTSYFSVGLSCPQETDVYATVVVLIDGCHAASEVVKVPAGKTRSDNLRINVGRSFVGQAYRLVVE